MRILFDAYWWVNGPVSNQQILHEVVSTWIREFPQDSVTLAVRQRDRDAVRESLGDGVDVIGLRGWPHGISVIGELPLRAMGKKFDFMVTQNFTPLFGRSAVFIQDVLFRTNPEWFTRAERLYFPLMIHSGARSQVIFASTKSEAARILKEIPRARRIRDVGLGVSSSLTNSKPVAPRASPASGEFLLTVGRLNIRKNVEFVCEVALDSGVISRDFPLVVAGTPQGKSSSFSSRIRPAVDDGSIIFLGRVTNAELAWLYSNTASFVFMTHGEGFGLPPLEALSFGSPVIASDIPVMREVLGGHATFVSPGSVEDLTRTLVEVDSQRGVHALQREARIEWGSSRYTYLRTVNHMRRVLLQLEEQ